jgi:hypothetical protein
MRERECTNTWYHHHQDEDDPMADPAFHSATFILFYCKIEEDPPVVLPKEEKERWSFFRSCMTLYSGTMKQKDGILGSKN